MNDVLAKIEAIIQQDVNNRGLAKDPADNLITRCAGDFTSACRSLAEAPPRAVGVVTGFYIPSAGLPETDGPLGAYFLARALAHLGWRVYLFSEPACCDALRTAGELDRHRSGRVTIHPLPLGDRESIAPLQGDITHLLAIERPGPSYLDDDLPPEHRDQCHTMGGKIVTQHTYPAHRWFEDAAGKLTTIGIGDGGNEIGMGKIPRNVIARNIPNGQLVACRVRVDHNIVCGISNWGAYALAAGVWHLKSLSPQPPLSNGGMKGSLFDPDAEHDLWDRVLRRAPLVDGMTGQVTLTVDGLPWPDYIRVMSRLREAIESC
jgi:hypothetical protein